MKLVVNHFIDVKKILGKSCIDITTMINILKKIVQKNIGEFSQCEQLCIDRENEYLVMSCGAFNPRFLAKIKRSKAGTRT